VEGRRVAIGSAPFIARETGRDVPATFREEADRGAAEALTPLLVAVDGEVVAVAALGDTPRPDAAAVLERIARRGWEIGVLSGDHPAAVASVARRIGLDPGACRGGVTPEEKAERVAAGRDGPPVVMVGDGVNDAAALAAASVGVAVHGGAEAALAAADVYVVRPGLAPVAELLDGAQRAMRVVRRNLIFSLLYNVAGAALAMAGLVGPLAAAVLMPLSSLVVVASSYRARTFDP
jgi:Cu2+-exporting ATPase